MGSQELDLKAVGKKRLLHLNEMDEFQLKHMRTINYIRSELKIGMICIFKEGSVRLSTKSYYTIRDSSFFLSKLRSRWLGPYTITQVFSYGVVEITHEANEHLNLMGSG